MRVLQSSHSRFTGKINISKKKKKMLRNYFRDKKNDDHSRVQVDKDNILKVGGDLKQATTKNVIMSTNVATGIILLLLSFKSLKIQYSSGLIIMVGHNIILYCIIIYCIRIKQCVLFCRV